MMKVLDYDKVNGTQDRDDTILVAHIMPRTETSSGSSAVATEVENVEGKAQGPNYFDSKKIVVSEVRPGSGPMSPVEGSINPV